MIPNAKETILVINRQYVPRPCNIDKYVKMFDKIYRLAKWVLVKSVSTERVRTYVRFWKTNERWKCSECVEESNEGAVEHIITYRCVFERTHTACFFFDFAFMDLFRAGFERTIRRDRKPRDASSPIQIRSSEFSNRENAYRTCIFSTVAARGYLRERSLREYFRFPIG